MRILKEVQMKIRIVEMTKTRAKKIVADKINGYNLQKIMDK